MDRLKILDDTQKSCEKNVVEIKKEIRKNIEQNNEKMCGEKESDQRNKC